MLSVKENLKKNNHPEIVYQDLNLIVINKPAGWITNDAQTTKDKLTVQTWLSRNCRYDIAKSWKFRSGIVHRLDKDTSGILLVAKNKDCFESLQALFKNRQVQKSYLALTHGRVKDKEGIINAPVGRLPWRRDRFGVLAGGREATTKYQVVNYYRSSQNEKDEFTLLELTPKTGRTHQIRIHLKYLGHPIVSDHFYAGRKTARQDLSWCPRLFLHAEKASFTLSAKKYRFHVPLPSDLTRALHALTPAINLK